MQLFATAFSTATEVVVDRLREVPTAFWVKIGLGVAVVVGTVILLRKVAKVNKAFLAVGVLLVLSIVGFNWIYERNEPGWATPAVSWLSGFFPSKGVVAAKKG